MTTTRSAEKPPLYSIDRIPPEGLDIVAPGKYVVTNDVTWSPPVVGKGKTETHAAIRIACSHVLLDMGGHTLTCRGLRLHDTLCIGVAVLPVLQHEPLLDVQVVHGTVQNFSAYGVFIAGVHAVRVSDVHVQGLRNANLTHTSIGIFLAGCDGVRMRDCTCTNSRVRSKAHSGIQLLLCTNVAISNVEVSRQYNAAGGSGGLALVASRLASISRVRVANMSAGAELAPGSSGNTCVGVFLYLSAAATLSRVTVTNIHGSCDDSHGISVFVCPQHVLVSECSASNVTTGFLSPSKSGAKATGVEVIAATDVAVSDCVATFISALSPQDKQVAGFSSGFTWHVSFTNCTASNCSVENGGAASGAEDREAHAHARGVGFGWGPDPRPLFIKPSVYTVYSNCIATRCDIAFDLFMHQHARLTNCFSKHCAIALNDVSDETRVLRCNACSECDPPLTTTIKNKGNNNVGRARIAFPGPSNSKRKLQ